MKDLKIDPDLRDLLPTLPKEKFEGLERMISEEGYDGTPLLIWNGFIIDGHHRYKIFKKHNIEFNTEEISLPSDCDKSDVMEWMITYQDVRRNMCEAEKIYANDKVYAKRIQEWNYMKKLEGNKNKRKRTGNVSDGLHIKRDRSTNTREQRAKLSGVSIGTIARYDTVMKSDDQDLKHSMLSGDITIGAAYKKVKNKENKNNTSIPDFDFVQTLLAKSLKDIKNAILEKHEINHSQDNYNIRAGYLSSYMEEIKEIKTELGKIYYGLPGTEDRKPEDIDNIITKYGYTVKSARNNKIYVSCIETLLNLDGNTIDDVFNFIYKIFPYHHFTTLKQSPQPGITAVSTVGLKDYILTCF